MHIKGGGLEVQWLTGYVNKRIEEMSLSPLFFLLFYIRNLLATASFLMAVIFLSLVLHYQNIELYKLVIAFAFASGFVPFYIYLKVRSKSISSTKD